MPPSIWPLEQHRQHRSFEITLLGSGVLRFVASPRLRYADNKIDDQHKKREDRQVEKFGFSYHDSLRLTRLDAFH